MIGIVLELLGTLCVIALFGYGAYKVFRPAVKREMQEHRRGD